MRGNRLRAVCGAAAVAAGLTGVVVGLWLGGRESLALPGSWTWRAVSSWYEGVGPEVAAIAAVRAGALWLALWLLAGSLVELIALVLGGVRARRLADLIAPRSLQRVVHGLAGLSLTAGLTAPAPSAGILAAPSAGVAVMRLVDDPPTGPGTATMRPLLEPAPAAVAVQVPVMAQPAPVVPAQVEAPPSGPVRSNPDAWVVVAGESFWSISEDVVAERLGRSGTDREVAAHWQRLIAANRERLADPANPDLLYPGQELVVPAP